MATKAQMWWMILKWMYKDLSSFFGNTVYKLLFLQETTLISIKRLTSEEWFCLKWHFFFLKILAGLKHHPFNLVSYHFGSLTLHPATYSSLINFNHEWRIRSCTLTSLCHGQLCTGGFCSSPLKPQPMSEPSQCPAGAQVCLFLGWFLGALSGWHRAKPAACAPPWAGVRTGRARGRVGSLGVHSLALPPRWHPVAVWDLQQSTRVHSPPTGMRQRTLCLHLESWLFIARQSILFPMVISRNLTCSFKTQGQLPHSPALHSHDLNVF